MGGFVERCGGEMMVKGKGVGDLEVGGWEKEVVYMGEDGYLF